MTPDNIDMLQKEVEMGQKAQRAYTDFIQPYISSKKLTLFNNFCDASMSNTDVLMEAKRMVTVLDDLEDSVVTIINSGKLAAKSLQEGEKE